MKVKSRHFVIALLVVVLCWQFVPGYNAVAQAPDVINQYTVTVTPQSDGSLIMKYEFDYTATTDFPYDKPFLAIGVPNRDFDLLDFGPRSWVSNAYKDTTGGSFVHLDFVRVPKAGDNFKLNFTIQQRKMVHIKNDLANFQFTPGWFDFARISSLNIIWILPEDASLVQSLDPQPERNGNVATWTASNLRPDQKYTVSLQFARSAYPNAPVSSSAAEVSSDASDTEEEDSGLDITTICFLTVVIFLVILLIWWFVNNIGDSYSGGSWTGGTGSSGGDFGSGPDFSGLFGDSSGGRRGGSGGRNAGGSGNLGGRGSSCACVSAGPSCVSGCAGAGRAGCSAKFLGIGIENLFARKALISPRGKKTRNLSLVVPVCICIVFVMFAMLLTACSPQYDSAIPTDNPSTSVDESIVSDKGQPQFPQLDKYWVIDNGCHFDLSTVEWADEIFEKLRLDTIAEVAVVCQTGIKSNGPMNDEKIWALKWGRWVRLGDKEYKRAVVWLIRPDVDPQDNRVAIEVSTWLTWYTAMDYGDTLQAAAGYANYDDFSGALEAIASGTNEGLRKIWNQRNTNPN